MEGKRLEALSLSKETKSESPLLEAMKSLASNLKVDLPEDLLNQVEKTNNFNRRLKMHLKILKKAEEKLNGHLSDLEAQILESESFLKNSDISDLEFFLEYQSKNLDQDNNENQSDNGNIF